MCCRWAHPHSGPSRNSFIRPSEWPHSSPSPQLVMQRLCRGPRTNFSLFPLPDLPRTTHLSHASLLLRSMWWLELQGSSLASNCLELTYRWNVSGVVMKRLCMTHNLSVDQDKYRLELHFWEHTVFALQSENINLTYAYKKKINHMKLYLGCSFLYRSS